MARFHLVNFLYVTSATVYTYNGIWLVNPEDSEQAGGVVMTNEFLTCIQMELLFLKGLIQIYNIILKRSSTPLEIILPVTLSSNPQKS